MKLLRIFLIGLGVGLAGLLALAAAALNPRLQTWAVHRWLGSQPSLQASCGTVAVGLTGIELRDLRLERNGAVLTLPSLRIEGPMLYALVGRKAVVRLLVATGWTLDLSRVRGRITGLFPPGRRTADPRDFGWPRAARADDAGPVALPAVAPVFDGLLERLRLPVAFQLDALELDGDVVLPPTPGWPADHVHLAVSGGGLAPGGRGRFDFRVRAVPDGGPVSAVNVQGTLTAAMDTPRTFARLAIRAEGSATGGQLPAPVSLTADLATARTAAGEDYTLVLTNADQRLVVIHATFPSATHRLSGTWLLDLDDANLSPFALGRPLPAFAAAGNGRFSLDADWSQLQASGRLNATADRLQVLRPELGALGALQLTAEFDLACRDGDLRVDRLTTVVAGAQPYVAVRALQPFEFNARTGELKVADAGRPLLGFTLTGMPLGWAQRLLPTGWVASAAGLSGSFLAQAGDGGLALRAKAPLILNGLSVVCAGQPVVDHVDAALTLAADYTPSGWQVEIARATAQQGGAVLLTLTARVGRLAGPDQKVKAAGRFTASLPALLAQPVFAGAPAVTGGNLACDFTASLGVRRSVQAKIVLFGLAAASGVAAEAPPALSADVRADFEADGRCVFAAPITWARGGPPCDLDVAGTLIPSASGPELDAQVTSGRLGLTDARLLGAALAGLPGVWPGARGRILFAVKELDGAPFAIGGGGGTASFGAGALELEGFHAGLGESGQLEFTGRLALPVDGIGPATFRVDASLHDVESDPICRAFAPGEPPVLDGRFDAVLVAEGTGGNLPALAASVRGRLELTSRGGVCRLLRTRVADEVKETPSFLSGMVQAFGSLLGEKADDAKRRFDKSGRAVIAISDRLREVHYDQLGIVAERGADGAIAIRELTLIAPELRITGSGRIDGGGAPSFADEPLELTLRLGAQGQTADLLNQVGLLGAQKDDLGYTELSAPVHLGGTLARIDDRQWRAQLVKAAVHKAAGGLLDKFL